VLPPGASGGIPRKLPFPFEFGFFFPFDGVSLACLRFPCTGRSATKTLLPTQSHLRAEAEVPWLLVLRKELHSLSKTGFIQATLNLNLLLGDPEPTHAKRFF